MPVWSLNIGFLKLPRVCFTWATCLAISINVCVHVCVYTQAIMGFGGGRCHQLIGFWREEVSQVDWQVVTVYVEILIHKTDYDLEGDD